MQALASMLGDCTPPPARGGGAIRAFGAAVLEFVASLGANLAAGRDASPRGAATAADVLPADAPEPMRALQPPPPPRLGPVLTLDPVDGTIVLPDELDGGGGSFGGSGGDPGDAESGSPTSWVPVTGVLAILRTRLRLGPLVDRIGALLEERGLTRLQLLALLLVAPLVVAFAIDVVVRLAS